MSYYINNMNNKIDISIYVACYNESKYILQTLDSIIEACCSLNIKYEIIIVDDCSTDNTRKVIKKFRYFNF